MRTILALLSAISCTACSQTTPLLITDVVSVKTPVVTDCKIQLPSKPESFVLSGPLDSLYVKGLAVMQELEAQRDYTRKLEAIISKCATSAPP